MSGVLLRACGLGLTGAASTSAISKLQNAFVTAGSSYRNMAVYVEVKENRVQQALSELNRLRNDAGLPDELRKRRYYINGSDARFLRDKNAYKHAVGAVVVERIKWVMRRKGTK
ncbi:hypothetical protein Agub_g7883 [Astrephomene gubernaculifera]|uniref:Mitochondrial ribosomal protein S21 n=1 Tax=Astrephomene gubernaculifera TaxID=47775 RepID=A0AAD3DR38_9CHLO|nr:hypothetical protein Agub_g7883 [Astrephomene gubernaculifera]